MTDLKTDCATDARNALECEELGASRSRAVLEDGNRAASGLENVHPVAEIGEFVVCPCSGIERIAATMYVMYCMSVRNTARGDTYWHHCSMTH